MISKYKKKKMIKNTINYSIMFDNLFSCGKKGDPEFIKKTTKLK